MTYGKKAPTLRRSFLDRFGFLWSRHAPHVKVELYDSFEAFQDERTVNSIDENLAKAYGGYFGLVPQ